MLRVFRDFGLAIGVIVAFHMMLYEALPGEHLRLVRVLLGLPFGFSTGLILARWLREGEV